METTRTIRNQANCQPTVQNTDNGISMTVPNMVPDIRTMIKRRATGLSVPQFPAHYSEENYPDFFKMDEIQLMEYRTNLAKGIEADTLELQRTTKVLEEKQNPTLSHVEAPKPLEPNKDF